MVLYVMRLVDGGDEESCAWLVVKNDGVLAEVGIEL